MKHDKVVITWDSWYDGHGNRYIKILQGNVRISIQMQKNYYISCYIDILLDKREYLTFNKHGISTLKDVNAYIKKTYTSYKKLYKLGAAK